MKRYSATNNEFFDWNTSPLSHYSSFFVPILPNEFFPYQDASLNFPYQFGGILNQWESYHPFVIHKSKENTKEQEIISLDSSKKLIFGYNLRMF